MTTPAIPEGFTPHVGRDNPAPGKRVMIMTSADTPRSVLRWYSLVPPTRSDAWEWDCTDIIAYRVVGDTE